MKRPSIIFVAATVVAAALGSESQANARVYVDGGFLAEADARFFPTFACR